MITSAVLVVRRCVAWLFTSFAQGKTQACDLLCLSALLVVASVPHTGVAGVTPTASLPTWNPTTDFSVTNSNPNGVWSYGFMDTAFTTFTPYVNKGTTGTYRNWYGTGGDQTPAVGYNTADPMNGVPAGYLLLHPGQAQEPTVLRWTSPLAATLKVVGHFHAGDGGIMQVAVRKGATVLFNATDAGAFDLTVAVAIGDTLDFTVFGGYAFGSTGLQVTISATSIALPLTIGDSNKIAVANLAGGTLVQLSVTGSGDLANANLQTNPDGSLAAPAGAPWTTANAGSAYPNVAGFPFGDGINHFVGGGLNYDHSGGSSWMFAGKQTTDTADPAAIRAGAVVGTFAASPAREDWFFVGYGRTVTVPAGGGTLYLAVNESFSTDNHGSYTVVATTATPANDAFASAEVITGNSISRTGTNVLASKESSEPNHASNVGGASVWWKWTAPSTGLASVSTIGSSFDTVLGVYTGNAVNALTAVASDDNSGPANTSKLTFNATAGTVYSIAVDGAGGAAGNVTLNVGYTYTTTTLAGTIAGSGPNDGSGTAARFNTPTGVAVDGSGTVYIADHQNATVRKITSAGVVTTLAGSPGSTGSTDATGAAARFNRPFGIAVDLSGNVFVSDFSANHTIRKITPTGVVTTFAGSAGLAGSTDATGAAARFTNPTDLALDTAGNLYVADRGNHTVRKISPAGVVTTLAGSAGLSGSTDGAGSVARFNRPQGIAVDSSGNVFVSDSDNHTIRKITAAGVVTTLAGSAGSFGNVDGAGSAARFRFPYAMAVDAAGHVFVDDYGNGTIRKITPAGVVITVATGFNLAQGLALDPAGNLLVADSDNHVVRKLIPSSAPVIASISPITVASGSTVTLTGNGFIGATAVRISGASAAFTVLSDTSLSVIIPAGTTSGPVSVTTVGGTSGNTGSLTVVTPTNSTGAELVTRVPTSLSPLAASGSLQTDRRMVSDDGRYVAFTSNSSRIVAGQTDTNAANDVFLWDRQTSAVTLVSHAFGLPATAGNAGNTFPEISGDGRYIVYASDASNLVAADTNNRSDVFLYDATTGLNTLVSRSVAGTDTANGHSNRPIISRDGRYLAYQSAATNLVAGQIEGNPDFDIFIYDRVAGTSAIVTHAPGSLVTTAGAAESNKSYAFNTDGRWLVYQSKSTNLVAGITDANNGDDVFLYETATGANTLVSHTSSSTTTASAFSLPSGASPQISPDGAYVAFLSTATKSTSDLFLYARATGVVTLVSHAAGTPVTAASNGASTSDNVFSFSADGRYLAYISSSSDLVADISKTIPFSGDVYRYDRTTDTSILVSRSAGTTLTTPNAHPARRPTMSADGRYIAFESGASDLVSGFSDLNGSSTDIFLFDATAGTTTLVSRAVGTATTSGRSISLSPQFSPDGTTVTYVSVATNVASTQIDFNSSVDVYQFNRTAGTNLLVSRQIAGNGGVTTGHDLAYSAVSADGRYVAFTSNSSNFVAGQTATTNYQVYRWDRTTGLVTLVTHTAGSATTTSNGSTSELRISTDGRYVAYESSGTDLVSGQSGDNGGSFNTFLYDAQTGLNILVSHVAGSNTTISPLSNRIAGLSDDGRYVFYSSQAGELIAGMSNPSSYFNIYRWDRATDTTLMVSHADGAPLGSGNADSVAPLAHSSDGRYVAFSSRATNLVTGQTDTNRSNDVFLRDCQTDTLTLVSRASSSATITASAGGVLQNPGLVSDDGRYVAFYSSSSDVLADNPSTTGGDLFLFDATLGRNTLVSHAAGSTAGTGDVRDFALSADGRTVAYTSTASNLVSGQNDTNFLPDLFVYDRLTDTNALVSRAAGTTATTTAFGVSSSSGFQFPMTRNARYVAFTSASSNFISGVTSANDTDVYVADTQTGQIALASRQPGGIGLVETGNSAIAKLMAPDAPVVVFASSATNLVANNFATGYAQLYLFEADLSAPSVAIGVPTATTTPGTAVSFPITYTDVASVNLSPAQVVLTTTGNVAATVAVSGSGTARTVTLSGFTGTGTVNFSLLAGTAVDASGNAAPAAGPSAVVTVATVPAAIANQPTSFASGALGGSVTLTVGASSPNAGSLTYQWRKFGSPLPGATSASLSLSGLVAFDGGLYDVIVSNNGSPVSSTASRVTVTPADISGVVVGSATFAPRLENDGTPNWMQRGSDGKIYLAGDFTSVSGVARAFLARFLADGSTLDPSWVPVPVDGAVRAFAVQADGKVVVGGDFTAVGGVARSRVARLQSDGSLDPAFVTDVDIGVVNALLALPDGRIVVGGSTNGAIALLTASGARDLTFVAGTGFDGRVNALVRQFSDGKIVAGGRFTDYNSFSVGRIARFDSSGTLDTVFRQSDNFSFGESTPEVKALAVQTDGQIVAAGRFSSYSGTGRANAVRLNAADASLDASFMPPGFNNEVSTLDLQSDGKVIAAGAFGDGRVARLLTNGSRDPSFAVGGGFNNTVTSAVTLTSGQVLVLGGTSVTTYDSLATGKLTRLSSLGARDSTYSVPVRVAAAVSAIAAAPGGKWVVGGNFEFANGVARAHLARFDSAGALDQAFDTGSGFNGAVSAVLVQLDGSVIAGGSFTTFNGVVANRIARVDAFGARETSFVPGAGFNTAVNALAFHTDGRIYVGGSFTLLNNVARSALVRLTVDGAVDPTFVQTGTGLDSSASVSAIVVHPNGAVYVGGAFTGYNGTASGGLARLSNLGAFDSTFAVGTGFDFRVRALALQPDGKLVVAGLFSTYQGTFVGSVTRLLSNGQLDTVGNGGSGFVVGNVPTEVRALLVQADGRIIVGGLAGSSGATAVARVNADGTLDSTLQAGGYYDPVSALAAGPGGLLVGGGKMIFPARAAAGLVRLEAPLGPTITTQPVAATVALGTNVTLSVTATGATSYQWVKNGNSVLIGTNSTLTFSPVTLADVGNYYVLANGSGGTTQSNGVTLTVTVPVPVALVANSTVLKTPRYLATDGTDWFVSGVRQDNSQSIFKFPFAGGAVDAPYVGLTSPLSVAVLGSDVYWIDPNSGPISDTQIRKAPKTGLGPVTSIYTGSSVGEPLVDGSGLTTDGTVLYAADEFAGKVFRLNPDGSNFTASAAGARFAANFPSERLITVAHEAGVLYFADAGRSGADSPTPKILSLPVAGSTFTTLGNGAPLVSPAGIAVMGGKVYVSDPGAGNTIWQLPLAGGTPVAYYSGAPLQGIAGLAAYNGELYVADSTGGAIYRLAQTPAAAPVITAAPTAVATTNGANVTFSVTATGVPAVSYQWRFNGNPIANATSATLALNNVGSTQVGNYSVTVTNGVDSVTSAAVALSGPVVEPVFVTQPLAYTSGNVGSSVTLTAAATATAGVTYQWRKHGQPIAGATNAALTLANLTLFESGLYDVLVTTSGVGFASTASRVEVLAPVSPTNVLAASSTFTPRIEDQFAFFSHVYRSADGKVYLSGNFTSIYGALRPGFARLLADGTLDTAFAPAPVFRSSGTPRVYAVAVQSNGRVLIGGQFAAVGGLPRDGLARLNLDGTVDPSFVPPSNLTNSDRVLALAVQPDGKILVAGSFNDSGVNIARLNADGSRDTTFAVAGGFSGTVNALALQSDGKIIVAGSLASYQGTAIGNIARLSSTGALDTDYRTAGGSGFNGVVRSLVLQPDGKLLVGGEFTSYGGSPRNRLVRLLDTGALDIDFSIGAGFSNTVAQLALQSDGAVVVVGDFTTFDNNSTKGIVRLTSAGARDITFVTSSELDASPGFNDGADGVALLSNGVLVLSNDSSRYASPTANVGPLTRLTALGALDLAFAPATRSAGTVEALVPAPGGRWFVAGTFTHVNGVARKNLARLLADGSLDPDFAPVGAAFNSTVLTLAVQPDGKVVAGGQFTAYDGTTVNRIVRLTTTGARDTTFDTGTGFDLTVASLALQTDGKLLVGGRFTTFNSVARRKLLRLTTAGALDPTFTQTGAGFGFTGSVNELAVLADGRVYAAGDFTVYDGTARYRIARFLADGTLDPAFVVGNSNAINYTIDALVVQPDGKLLVGGQFYSFGDFATTGLARINPDGTRDIAFTAFESNGNVTAIALLSDGRIVVGGSFTTRNFSAPLPMLHLARLSPTGIVEPDFGAPLFNSTPTAVQPSASGALLVSGGALYFPDTISAGLARLDAAPVPAFTTPPAKQIASVGDSVTFTVTATGPGLTYRWLKDGAVISGATGTSFTIPSAQLADVGSYAVVVANVYGSITSPAVELTGAGAAPTISSLTAPAVLTGSNAQLAVTATGVTAYQWRKLGVPISGNTTATTATLTLPGAVLADASFYDVLVYNGLSRTRSSSVRLAVTAAQPVGNPVSPDLGFPAFTESFTGYGTPNRIFAQPDGKYYISGDFVSVDGAAHIGLVRFLANGTVDTSFTTEISGGTINAFAAQSDGKLIIAGDFHRVNGVEANHLARLNADGTLDTAFCSGPNSGTFDSIYAVAVQADGKILLGGHLSSIGGIFGGGGLVRLNSSGTVDTAFGGTIETGFNGPVDALAVDGNGRIFAGGRFTTFQGNSASYFAVLTASGTRAANFAGLTTGFNNSVTSILVLADGRVVAGGSFDSYNSAPASRIVRLAPDGTVDSTFLSGGGFDYVDSPASVSALALQADGKLLVTGAFARYDRVSARNLARLNPNGTRDTGFDTSAGLDGPGTSIAVLSSTEFAVVGDFTGAFESVRARYARFSGSSLSTHRVNRWGNFDGEINTVVPAPDGKWLVGGYFSRIGGAQAFNLARLNADGSLDSTFSLAQGPVYGSVYALAVQGDGKILVGGDFNHYGTEEIYVSAGGLLRLNPDGTRDIGFKLGNGFDSVVRALAVQPDGKVLVGGGFMNLNSVSSARFARLNADGTRDASFALGTGFGSDVYAITVLPDGRLAVGGEFAHYNGFTGVRGLIYLSPDGTRDTTVATGYTTGFSGNVTSLVLQPDGRLLVGGGFSSYGSTVIYSVARLTTTGALDSTFAIGSTFFYGEGFASIVSLALQSDGKVIVAGDFPTVNDVNGTQQIARFTATGAHDPTFTPNFSGDPRSVTLRADGKLFVAGRQLTVSDTLRYGLLPIGGPAGTLPTITTPPVAQSAVFGGSATFSVVATGTPAPTYQWQRNNVDISGATNASYTVASASQANAGLYRVIVTNSAGSVPTTPVALDVVTRNLINFYARAIIAPAGNITSSFTIEGTQSKTVLLVGVGGTRASTAVFTAAGGGSSNSDIPALGARIDPAPAGLADPRLTLTDAAGNILSANNDWTAFSGAADLVAAAARVAATPGLSSTGEGAADAALLVTLAPGTYHAKLDGADAGGGAAILQIFDADSDGRPRLVMFTLRAKISTGAGVATAGFTVDGGLSKTYLLRALGEALGTSPGVLDDPTLTLYRGRNYLTDNDDTNLSGGIVPVAIAQAGARLITNSLDSTVVQTLSPGVYTAVISPFGLTGTGLVQFELFETDAQRSSVLAPTITYFTPDQIGLPGDVASFGVLALAKPAATYQWRKGGLPLAGATDAVLRLTGLTAESGGTYDVAISSGSTTLTSPPRVLTIAPEFHVADTNRDNRIGLLELTRIIQLYNVRDGTVRTGEYHSLAGTEDGFTLGAGTRTAFHSADSNRDGRIDVTELTRVIELYNFLEGSTRTGRYRPALDTEDGFAPGPGEVRLPALRSKK